MFDETDMKQLKANALALETKIVGFEDLVPVARFTSGAISWLAVKLDDRGCLGGVVNWGFGFLPFDHLLVEDFLAGTGPMCSKPVRDPEFESQWPVSSYLTGARWRPVVVEKRSGRALEGRAKMA
jgi:hypothetical protein